MVRDGRRRIGITVGTGPRSLATTSKNMSRMGVATALMHVGTTTSVLSTPLVDLMVYPVEYPSNPQSPPLQTLLYGVYPRPNTLSLPLSGYVSCLLPFLLFNSPSTRCGLGYHGVQIRAPNFLQIDKEPLLHNKF